MAMSNSSNPHGGMNDEQAQKDRSGFTTEAVNTTGGQFKDLGENAGMEVGNSFDEDPMGETESKVTYKGGK